MIGPISDMGTQRGSSFIDYDSLAGRGGGGRVACPVDTLDAAAASRSSPLLWVVDGENKGRVLITDVVVDV